MAKKKAAKRDGGKARFEVRFDSDVTDGLKKLAESAGVSVNQLLHGLARWAVQSPSFSGDPVKSDNGFVTRQSPPQQGALWWGREGSCRIMDAQELDALRQRMIAEHGTDDMIDEMIHGGDYPRNVENNGEVFCRLDFTERRVVRED